MASSVIGALRVMLGMDTAEFESGTTKAQREMQRLERNFQRTAANVGRIGRNLTIGLTAPLTAFGVLSFNAASDAAELESAFNQTFGNMAGMMNDWARETGDAMGRSTQSMQRLANTFGIFFNQAAPTREEAARMSQTFAVLAQDLASFYNVAEEDALQKLRSGLSGEAEPLRDFGVFLSAAAVEARALEMGLGDASGEISEQAKILARYNLILESTTNAQGDVLRTADGTANRVRAAQAAFEELQVTIGTKLLPVITPLIDKLAAAFEWFTALPDSVQATTLAGAALAAALGPVLLGISGIIQILPTLITGFRALTVASLGLNAALGPVALGLTAVAGLVLLLQQRQNAARAEMESYRAETEDLANWNEELEARLLAAGAEIQNFGNSSDTASGQLGAYREAVQDTADDLETLRVRAIAARYAMTLTERAGVRAEIREMQASLQRVSGSGTAQNYAAQAGITPGALAQLQARDQQLGRALGNIQSAYNSGIDLAGGGPGGGGGTGGTGGGRAGGGGGGGGGGRGRASNDPAAQELASLMDRLFPELTRMRELQEDQARIAASSLSAQQQAAAQSRLRYELAGVDPLGGDRPDIDVLGDRGRRNLDQILDATARVPDVLEETQRRTEEANRRMAESFEEAARRANMAMNQLEGVLAGLTDLFTDLFGKKWGGIFGTVAQLGMALFRAPGGGSRMPGFASGGSMTLGGMSGIDRNVLSLNGMPIARVSRGEGMHITPAGVGTGGLKVTVTMDPSTGALGAFVQDTAGRVVARAAPGIAGAGADMAMTRLGKRQRKSLVG